MRLENRRDQEWLMTSLPHHGCVSVVWTAHRTRQHAYTIVPQAGNMSSYVCCLNLAEVHTSPQAAPRLLALLLWLGSCPE